MKRRYFPWVPTATAAVMWAMATSLLAAPAAAEADPGRHYVFAHYMVCFTQSVEFCKQEIDLAQRHGIDGFALNAGGWIEYKPATGQITPRGAVLIDNMYEAARQLGTGFKLMLSADLNSMAHLVPHTVWGLKRWGGHPNQFKHEGKVVYSAWCGGPGTYVEAIAAAKKEGIDVCFVPFLYAPKYPLTWSSETVRQFFLGHPHMDGIFQFACDDTPWGLIRTNAIGRRTTMELGKIFMAGNVPAYNGANLRDYRGMFGYGAVWEGIIRDGADWVELVTWNDYNEDSHLNAYRWKDGWNRHLFNRDEAFLDVTAYYAAWYKSGVRPTINQDKLYYVYRNRPKWLTKEWDWKAKRWVGESPAQAFDQFRDDVRDYVYVSTFLTESAELTVALGETETKFEQPAGIAHVEVPLAAGTPQFTLRRNGRVLTDVVGRKQIVIQATEKNSVHHDRACSRAWTGGAAVGPVLRIEAEKGQLSNDAQIVRAGSVVAVRNAEQADSGFVVPVQGLRTGTYCVRIVYSNPTDEEARLTLMADGAPRGIVKIPGFPDRNEHAYYIPAFLPPTGQDKFVTASFLWSLYDKTTHLKLQWLEGRGMDWDKANPLFNDQGSPLIDAIELVPVEPVKMPPRRSSPYPELVDIPGGTFTMGAADANPDAKPAHQVTLSPFSIGKYEVTNEEFERFDPKHRNCRDEYSWRDREPVIYVDWRDGARYCNWLSQRAGLTPAYKETKDQWETNPQADGFRLPTEAEWEYVASGRDEGRKYPWGNDPPRPKQHGNFIGAASLEVDPNVRSVEGGGTMVVGTYPTGASRDGLMDLAGNVSEWCSDWRQPYTAAAQTNPHVLTPAPYRVIRGGSWGYYAYTQRCVDREFNSPKYPGYVYVGFRVALPEAGRKKLPSRP